MSTFSCPVVRIRAVEDHPNADRLSLNHVLGFVCISNRDDQGNHRYAPGDLVVYIPEGAIVPEWAMRRYGYWNEEKQEGFLSGSQHNRVKAVRLRQIMSLGLMFSIRGGQVELADGSLLPVQEGDNLADQLGIIKFEPPIPVAMAGQVCAIPGHGIRWDVENIKRYPDIFVSGETVLVWEKLHGSSCHIGIIPNLNHPDLLDDWYVISKGLGAQGLAFKDNEENAGNLYVKTVKRLGLIEKIKHFYAHHIAAGASVWVLGEVYGKGVQDLDYGEKEPTFAGFAIAVRAAGGTEQVFVDPIYLEETFREMGIPMVALLYEGPYDPQIVAQLTDGLTTMGGSHIREGVVVNPAYNRRDPVIGKVILKSVSENYLLRKGNVTEYT